MKKRVLGLILAGAMAATMLAGCGQSSDTPEEWPSKAVNVIVTASAGGDTDFNARTFATYFEKITGQPMAKYYRPPQGKYSEANLQMACDMGYRTFFWSLAYVDWYEDDQPTKEEAFEKLLGRIHPGAIVLLHSTSRTNAEILDELLTRWEEMGYRFDSLDHL